MKRILALAALAAILPALARAQAPQGYCRYPAIHGGTIIFTAEGDLWSVGIDGGAARRVTSHPGEESYAAISPDGATLAFSAQYEGPTEVYTMPMAGGLPTRRTYDGESALAQGWTPDGKVLYSTRKFATLPVVQLASIDPATGAVSRVPLHQASDGDYDGSGKTLFFTRLPFQGSHSKRYKGGTAQKIWKWTEGAAEAEPLTADFDGTSKRPMWWGARVYFVSDRDGTMNLWSMDGRGGDLRQHTRHEGWDIQMPSLSAGRIVYQLGADLHLYDIDSGEDRALAVTLASDLDQTREKWIRNPMEWLTAAHLSPDGDRVALTARGEVFVAPTGQGRLAHVGRRQTSRRRDARFLPDGKSLLMLSDQSGELEFWKAPANGVGDAEQLTSDGKVFRFDGIPSPDGERVAFTDKNWELWIGDLKGKTTRRIAKNNEDNLSDLAWSPDSKWLAYVAAAPNQFQQIVLWSADEGTTLALTSERVDSRSPAWSADGKWIYFLSDRQLNNVVGSPWGARAPDPYFDKITKIYGIALEKGLRFPFAPEDELKAKEEAAKKEKEKEKEKDEENIEEKEKEEEAEKAEAPKTEDAAEGKKEEKAEEKKDGKKEEKKKKTEVKIEREGLQARIFELPVGSGNYSDLQAGEKRLFYAERGSAGDAQRRLVFVSIEAKESKPKTLADDIASYELSLDRKKILIRKGDGLFVVGADSGAGANLGEGRVKLDGWAFSFAPRDEWRQMLVEAWRLERDYFYDRGMHGLPWRAILGKYLPLADRITDRAELSDLLGQMISELSALHMSVRGGEMRRGPDDIAPASLGAVFERAESDGGWRIARIYKADPDYPDEIAPLARPEVAANEGDIIESINGAATLSAPHPAALLRGQAGKQVLIRLRTPGGEAREAIVRPIGDEAGLRYTDWEHSRRLMADEFGKGEIGYVHLRAMGGGDYSWWARQFYPVFNRKGLVIDVRNNRGGNIDSWILGKLLRKAWFYWQPRVGSPYWNMQYAFRGPMVVICNEHTASDGEAFAEGFRRLGLGKVVGTRTWGGEIWLSYSNTLVDRGIASAAEIGVYGPEGEWLIEGHGVDPDIVVDNLPRATFDGDDAQLRAAIAHLQELIRANPQPVPPPPPHPNKAFKRPTTP